MEDQRATQLDVQGVDRDPEGMLRFSGMRLDELARVYGTPLLVLSENVARAQVRAFLDAFQGQFGERSSVSYASKALCLPALIRVFHEEGAAIEVASEGEIAVARAAGVSAAELRLQGNNKPDHELELAANGAVGQIVVDNPDELERWLARPGSRHVKTCLRVAVGVTPDTHEYIATGGRGGKFGFDLASGEALRGLVRAAEGGCRLWGVHAHIGSQVEGTADYEEALRRLLALRAAFAARTGQWLAEVNAGGGPAYRYTDEAALEADVWAAALAKVLRERAEHGPAPILAVEPGRALAAPAALTLYTVGDAHRVPGFTPVVAVDGGMGDNIRPSLYGARYRAARVEGDNGARERCHVVGRYCESGDVLLKDAELPPLRAGDHLAVFGTGAFTFSMSMRYNHVPRPAVAMVRSGAAGRPAHALVAERETVADLLRGQTLAPWQQAAAEEAAAGQTATD